MLESALPLLIKNDYIKLIEANAQHEPQLPWYLT